ncbi:MAG: helix-turn-helix domain-containing protein [Lachnospiraceae bacterium]|nr:helix-turn-helix domain-containing protein [Lachnospiraceae bacterium]
MYRIMLADDEGIVLDALQFIIEKNFGDCCEIQKAKTGRGVIELAEEFLPDIAFVDIQMPGINGIEAIKEIRKRNKNTIFIIVSAYDKFDYAKEAINLGVLEYINKPIRQEAIVDVLQKAINTLDKKRHKRSNDLKIREKLENVVPIIESGFIYSILFQEHFEEDTNNYKQLLGIEKYENGYMMAIIFGDGQEDKHMVNAVGAGVKVHKHYWDIHEMIKAYFPGIVGNIMANKIAVFIPCEETVLEYEQRIQIIEKSRELARKLRTKADVVFRIGIGSVKPMKEAIVSYNEAIDSLIQTEGSVTHTEDNPIGCVYAESYPIALEKALFENVERGDIVGCQDMTRRFFYWMETNYGEYIDDIRLKCLEFVLWTEKRAYENGGMTYHFLSRKDYMSSLMACADLNAIQKWFEEKIKTACRNVKGSRKESSLSVIEKAKSYINAHFQKDISLDEVSREVNVSPYYFSKLFKEETGKNYIEYMTEIRISKAKELLSQGNETSMKEICISCGYQDPNYFSRIFKKTVGLTPTEYREGVLKS